MKRATEADRGDWQYRYGLALLRAGSGADPRADAARALSMNPKEPLAIYAAEELDTPKAEQWPRRAAKLPLPQ